jgi:hypothetical protein
MIQSFVVESLIAVALCFPAQGFWMARSAARISNRLLGSTG